MSEQVLKIIQNILDVYEIIDIFLRVRVNMELFRYQIQREWACLVILDPLNKLVALR